MEMSSDFQYTFNSTANLLNETGMTEPYNYRRKLVFNILGSTFTVIIAITAIIGNSAVTFAVFWDETLRQQGANVFIVYLAVTDILTGLVFMLPSAVSVVVDYWPFGTVLCRMHTGFNYMFVCSSSFNISLISIDRAVAVMYPLNYHRIMSTKVIFGLCSFLFLLECTGGLLSGVPNWSTYDYTEGTCSLDYTHNIGVTYMFSSGFIFCYLSPAILVAISYTLIISAARRSSKALFIRRPVPIIENNHINKTIKSMIVIVCVYYICFTPYSIAKEYKVLSGIDMPPWSNYMTTLMVFVASATNPFIYAILRKDYRDAFKKILRMIMQHIHF